jgi:hypothetical protein
MSYSGIASPEPSAPLFPPQLDAQFIQLALLFASALTESGFSCTSLSGLGLLPAKVAGLSWLRGGLCDGGVVTSFESPLMLLVSLRIPGKLPDEAWPWLPPLLGIRAPAFGFPDRFDGMK